MLGEKMNNRRVKCPHCGVVVVNIPDDWTDEHALQNHFDVEYDNLIDIKYSNLSTRQRNPCYGRMVVIRGEVVEKYTKELLDKLEVGGVVI
jgi:hypothetical protein